MCELARTRKSPDRFQTCLCKKTRRNARCQRAFSADQKSSHGFPPRRPAPEPPLPSSLRWKRKSVSKERRRYSPLEPSQELARRSRSVEQSLSMLVPKSYPRTRCLPRAPRQGKMPSRSEEHTSELQSLMRISYAVICLKKKNT